MRVETSSKTSFVQTRNEMHGVSTATFNQLHLTGELQAVNHRVLPLRSGSIPVFEIEIGARSINSRTSVYVTPKQNHEGTIIGGIILGERQTLNLGKHVSSSIQEFGEFTLPLAADSRESLLKGMKAAITNVSNFTYK